MARDWLHWVGGATRRTSRRRIREDAAAAASPGCMCAVFHLFDLHLPLNHQHSFNHSPFLQQQASTSKGVEAPRNSLEMEEPAADASKPLAMEEAEQNLNFPVGINQIKTRASVSVSKSRTEDFQSDCSANSPGTKTPNLVARLMGLDLLPECSSPSFSCPNPKPPKPDTNRRSNTCFYNDDISVGARSLPETPRMSSARRSDVEYHRLSLQISKENINEEFVKIRGKRGRSNENRTTTTSSPGHYAKQIVKQVRESVSRRVGLTDVTNTIEVRRDQNLPLKLNKKNSPKFDGETTPSCSPKLRFLEPKKAKPPPADKNPTSSDRNKAKMMGKKKEEAFVRAKKGKMMEKKSSELLHISGPTILPLKKGPSPPATKLPQKQTQVSSDALSSKRNTQLSRTTRQSYKPLHKQPDKIVTVPGYVQPDSTNGCATSSAGAEYNCYIHKILKRAGIADKYTPLTLGKWHTPSHPLDPSIFYYLELFHPTASAAAVLSRRCNRKLIFQLVDELLADILDFKPWISPIVGNNDHFGLGDELCRKIENFPAANCQVLEDIDALIEKDLCGSPFEGEEAEGLVREIGGEIVEWLVSETVLMIGFRTNE